MDAVIGTNELEQIMRAVRGRRSRAESARAVPLPRPHAARARHAAALRLHQDRRGLRPSLHLLRDSAVSRQVPQPPLRVASLSEATRLFAAGRARDQPDRPGHHLLRRRSRHARTAWRCCWSAWRRSRREAHDKWVRFLYCLSQPRDAEAARYHRRARALVKYIDMPLQHASARRAEAHEARRRTATFS